MFIEIIREVIVMFLSRTLITESNTQITLQEMLLPKTTLVVLLRQGECIECTMMIDAIQKIYTDLVTLDVPIVFIANGEVESLSRIRNRLALSTSTILVTDPTLQIYHDFGLHSSMLATYGPKGLFNIAQGWIQGFYQTRFGNNQAQQSGLVLFDSNREIQWIHKSQYLGDLPNVGDILEQVLLLKVDGVSL